MTATELNYLFDREGNISVSFVVIMMVIALYIVLNIVSDKVLEMKMHTRAVIMDKFRVFASASLLGGLIIAISHIVLVITLALSESTAIDTLLALQLPSFIGCLITNFLYGLRIEKRRLGGSSSGQTKILWGGLISLITVFVGTIFFTLIMYSFIFLQTYQIPPYYLKQIWTFSQIAMNIYTFFTQNLVGGLIGGIFAFLILHFKGANINKRIGPSKTLKNA